VQGLKYELPLYHYLATNYDGSSVWTDIGSDKNNMTNRGGLVTKQWASNARDFWTVKLANNGGYNPYLKQLA